MSSVSVVEEGRSASELLEWGWRVIEPPLREAVSDLPVAARTVVGYHFGWSDRRGRPANGTHGKAFRPTLLLLSASAMRGRPSDLAENAGTRGAVAAGWLGRCVVRLCEGQYGDLGFERRDDVTLSECLATVADKTSALLECSSALGALLAGADDDRIDCLRAFGRALGIAFQVVDDLLGIWGDPTVTGKPAGADLARRKKTLPVVAALTSDAAAARELSALYRGTGPLDRDQVVHAARLVEEAGGRAWAQEEAAARLAEGAGYLDAADCEPRARAELLTLAALITRRDC